MRMVKAPVVFLACLVTFATLPHATISFTKGDPQRPASLSKKVLNWHGEQITIIRDGFGVPHVIASTAQAVFFGGGYAVAQDRLFQMERFRRDARGEMAEIAGQKAVYRDQQIRLSAYTEDELLVQYRSLSDGLRLELEAYVEGVNASLKEVIDNNNVPRAFKEAGISQPAPWRITDSIAIAVMMAQRFGSSGGSAELLNARILKKLKAKFGNAADGIFNDLFWLNDPKSPTTVPGPETPDSSPTGKRRLSSATRRLIERSDDGALRLAQSAAAREAALEYARANHLMTKWGSYAWVVSPGRSLSGSALLVGGPQMGFSTPQIGHEIHYSAGEFNAIGMGIAGLPGVLVGHNDHLAWTMTSGLSDMADVFEEKINPDNKYQYQYKGQWRDMQKRIETIKVRGAEPKLVEIYRTVHGPVLNWDLDAGLAYSLAESYALHEASILDALRGLSRAASLKQAPAILSGIYTNHNILAASVEGDIGYWHCGKPPKRAAGQDPRLPTPGTGDFEWQGLMPFEKMPQSVNPSQGYLISWNNKPARWWDNGDSAVWGEIFRIGRLQQLMNSRRKLSLDDMEEFVREIAYHNEAAGVLKPYLLSAIEETGAAQRNPRIQEAADYLRAWNSRDSERSVALTIFDAWFRSLRSAIFADELGELNSLGVLNNIPQLLPRLVTPSLVVHVLDGNKSGLPPSRDYLNGKSRNEVVIEALSSALKELESRRGPQMNLWSYGPNDLEFDPLPPVPYSNRGTYILMAELSKPLISSQSILAPGQSEEPTSPHFGDQREMAGYWRYKPLGYKADLLNKSAGN